VYVAEPLAYSIISLFSNKVGLLSFPSLYTEGGEKLKLESEPLVKKFHLPATPPVLGLEESINSL
jgi:hypothetical protein